MRDTPAQNIIVDEQGRKFIEYDWFPQPLPENLVLEAMSYPDTSYSFNTCFTQKPGGFRLGAASGNYSHGTFTVGVNGEVNIGRYVVLQSIRVT